MSDDKVKADVKDLIGQTNFNIGEQQRVAAKADLHSGHYLKAWHEAMNGTAVVMGSAAGKLEGRAGQRHVEGLVEALDQGHPLSYIANTYEAVADTMKNPFPVLKAAGQLLVDVAAPDKPLPAGQKPNTNSRNGPNS